eukprot:1740986-Rhodomonas_salina.1
MRSVPYRSRIGPVSVPYRSRIGPISVPTRGSIGSEHWPWLRRCAWPRLSRSAAAGTALFHRRRTRLEPSTRRLRRKTKEKNKRKGREKTGNARKRMRKEGSAKPAHQRWICLLYTSDAADDM